MIERSESDRRRLGLLLAIMLLLVSAGASAHPTPGSTAFLALTVRGAVLEQDVPIEELERAMHRRLIEPGESPAAAVARSRALLRAYAASLVGITPSSGGAPWSVEVDEVRGHDADDGPRATFLIRFDDVEGSNGPLRLHDAIVADEVVTHRTTVFLRGDWLHGSLGDEARLLGTIHAGRRDVTVPHEGSFLRGLAAAVKLGAEHIATGSDHLLFLVALLLVAPLRACAGRWSERRTTQSALFGILRLVTSFTVGHSLTLALVGLGGPTPPSVLVESTVALSVLVAAFHAIRPVFPRREAWIAGVFGLVHGLAFAGALPRRDLGMSQTLWTLFGFNLGIELAQVAVLFMVGPWLLLLARTRSYAPMRVGTAALVGALAVGWLVERTTSSGNPLAVLLAVVETHPLALLVGLALVAVAARVLDRPAISPSAGVRRLDISRRAS